MNDPDNLINTLREDFIKSKKKCEANDKIKN